MRLITLAALTATLCAGSGCDKDKPTTPAAGTPVDAAAATAPPGSTPPAKEAIAAVGLPGSGKLRSLLGGQGGIGKAVGKGGGLFGGAFGGLAGMGGAAAGAPAPPMHDQAGGDSALDEGKMTRSGPARPQADHVAAVDEEDVAPPPDYPPPDFSKIQIAAGIAGGGCTEVAAHLATFFGAVFAEEEAEGQAIAAELVGSFTGMLQKECETQRWSRQLMDCALLATSEATIEDCKQYAPAPAYEGGAQLAEDEDWEADGDFKPAPRGPAPVWDGKSTDCAAVARHATAFYLWQSSGDAEATAEMVELEASLEADLRSMCTTGNWPEAARMCVLKAGSEEEFDECGDMIEGA